MAEHHVYIGIGSNIDPEENIPQALSLLVRNTRLEGLSTFYRTDPIGRPGQPQYLNGVAKIACGQGIHELKNNVLLRIEEDLGRVREVDPYAARVIDLDILLFDDAIIWGPGLRIPDPDIWTRPFLAAALVELTPNLVPPDRRQPLAEAGCLRDAVLIPALDFSNELHKRFCE